jgi:hypothetical protein
MKTQVRHLIVFVTLCGAGLNAQVSIVNPKHVTVPGGRVEAIYHSALQVVAANFDEENKDILRFPVTLFLGEEDERYVADEDQQLDAVYLAGWNENKFTVSVMRLAMEHLLDHECRNQLLGEILSRADAISPVAIQPKRR